MALEGHSLTATWPVGASNRPSAPGLTGGTTTHVSERSAASVITSERRAPGARRPCGPRARARRRRPTAGCRGGETSSASPGASATALLARRRRPPEPGGPARTRASYRRCTSPYGLGSATTARDTTQQHHQARSTTTTTDARWGHFKRARRGHCECPHRAASSRRSGEHRSCSSCGHSSALAGAHLSVVIGRSQTVREQHGTGASDEAGLASRRPLSPRTSPAHPPAGRRRRTSSACSAP